MTDPETIGFDSSERLRAVRRDLVGRSESIAAAVIEGWHRAWKTEPWLAIPDEVDTDYLPELIESLAAATLRRDAGEDELRDMLDAGCKHGADRRLEGMAEDLIFREQYLLRRGLWDLIRKRYGDDAASLDAMMRLDTGLAATARAALFGYHRGAPDEADEWPAEAARIMEDYPLP